MCKSFDVSVMIGLYSYAIAYYLYRRNFKYDRGMALVLVTFSTIQWIEAGLWYDLNNLTMNRVLTALIPIVLGLEFLATLAAANMYYPVSNLEIIIYIIAFLALILMWYHTSSGYTTVDPETGSLIWGQKAINPILTLFFLVLLLYPLLRFIPGSTSIGLIVLVTTIFYIYSFRFGKTFASNWCWIANLVALIQLLSPYMQ